MNRSLSMFTVVATLILPSLPVFASDGKAYSADAIELANVIKSCPGEIAELGKNGPANAIISAAHEVDQGRDVYTVEFSAGGLAPSFSRYSVGTLRVTRTFVRNEASASDAPGGHIVFSCEIIQAAM
jgi:hypothetical protein